MQKLYLDCDGVILDTINTSYKMMEEENIKTDEDRKIFYGNLDWKELITKSGEIDNAIEKINALAKVYDVEVLTHIISEEEINAKREYFNKMLPDINIIYVPKNIRKADYVNPENSILVDDFLPNLEYWEEKGGIPVKFSSSGKSCKYHKIEDLLELLDKSFV